MKIFSLLMLAVLLTACDSSERPQTTTVLAKILQCGKDTDCKGDRICDSGICKNPPPALSTSPQEPVVTRSSSQTINEPASAKADDELQETLISALRQKPGTSERMGSSSDAIMGYANAGYINKHADLRADYSDYRILKKPASFMGHTLVAIEDEYMQEWVGCCVSPGMSVTVRVSPAGDDLETFASKNGCRVSKDTDDYYSDDMGLPKAPKGTYATLNCKERDLVE